MAQRKLRVVIVDEELPYPPDSGKRIRSFNLALRLARRHKITYLAHRSQTADETRNAATFLQDHGIGAVVVDRAVPLNSGPAFYSRLAANLLSPLPYSVQRHATSEMQAAVRRRDAEQAVDLWQAEWTPYARNLLHVVRAPWIVIAHNIESQIWQRHYESETNPLKRWYIGRQFRKYLKFEGEIFNHADKVVAVSDPDAELARQLFGTIGVEVVNNGVDVDYFHPTLEPRDPKTILFLGALFWRPNIDAVQILLNEIFPRVLASEPEAKLQIVGRDPPPWLSREVVRHRNVSLHPNVPDVRPFLWRCGMLAVPLRIGGGSRLKILEALACDCPVVSTRVGSEGLDLVPGRHYTAADSVPELASAILQRIRDPEIATRQASCGRRSILEKYSWESLSDELARIWEASVTRNNGTSPHLSSVSAPSGEGLGHDH